ncbi:GDP-perosamine synthase [Pseudoscourfieldia marina]
MTEKPTSLVVGRPNLVDKAGFLEDVERILKTRLFTNNGPYCEALQRNVEKYLGVRHCIAVANATVGLELVLRALEFEPGSEVIVPSYTFIATVHAVKACGLVPRFCDVDAKTHLITAESVSACLTRETVAIIGVHLWGLCCDVASLTAVAKAHEVTLLFDAAHAFGARNHEGIYVGNFGKAEVFSMHATKLFNSFEGGLITTNDSDLDSKLRYMLNFGIEDQDLIVSWGTNIKLSEVHAAFANRQLLGIHRLLDTYRTNASIYCEEFKRLLGIEVWNERFMSYEGCTHSYICVEVKDGFPMSRDEIMAGLRKHHIYAKRYFFPGSHRCKPYISKDVDVDLPNTEQLCRQVLVLPTGTCITGADIKKIVGTIEELIKVYHGTSIDTKITTDQSGKQIRLNLLQIERATLLDKLRQCEEEIEGMCRESTIGSLESNH